MYVFIAGKMNTRLVYGNETRASHAHKHHGTPSHLFLRFHYTTCIHFLYMLSPKRWKTIVNVWNNTYLMSIMCMAAQQSRGWISVWHGIGMEYMRIKTNDHVARCGVGVREEKRVWCWYKWIGQNTEQTKEL